ncbi:MAG: hypothetical protein KDB54_10450 [Solirubrobacterales bacterium]|nr:hypothetical protein [Solirubrobacterales bacterium]MCB0861062.1 hypothetical protein [Solirubrobacterales bacterium]MCB1882626.1 hypothetical protein [Geminicoccaceae bacterium]
MRAEFLKIRILPTPRWTLFALLLCFLAGVGFSVTSGVGHDEAVLDLAVMLPSVICSIVFGSWMAGVEFGQNTLRRSLAADPRRVRLVLAKAAATVITVAAVTVGLWALGMLVFPLLGSGHETTIDSGRAVGMGLAALLQNVVYALIALSLTLLTRSMGGGMAMSFAFAFVISAFLSVIPKVGDYMVSSALESVTSSLRDESVSGLDVGPAIVVVVIWMSAFIGLGIFRTLRTEVK